MCSRAPDTIEARSADSVQPRMLSRPVLGSVTTASCSWSSSASRLNTTVTTAMIATAGAW